MCAGGPRLAYTGGATRLPSPLPLLPDPSGYRHYDLRLLCPLDQPTLAVAKTKVRGARIASLEPCIHSTSLFSSPLHLAPLYPAHPYHATAYVPPASHVSASRAAPTSFVHIPSCSPPLHLTLPNAKRTRTSPVSTSTLLPRVSPAPRRPYRIARRSA
ncbi:hypothetical protein K438DRAFT_1992342 [Mycena galopus ATCC 62051]|nr:hypothetical protein K438DRAFT_1992342 [Mycena galopus ATCC 62051]